MQIAVSEFPRRLLHSAAHLSSHATHDTTEMQHLSMTTGDERANNTKDFEFVFFRLCLVDKSENSKFKDDTSRNYNSSHHKSKTHHFS